MNLNDVIKNRGKTMKSLKKARGITLIGFVFALGVLGIFLYAGMQIGPVYMEHFSVKDAMDRVAKEGGNLTPSEIKSMLGKSLNISYVTQVDAKDFKVVRGNGRQLQVNYVVEKEFIGNLGFTMKFSESVTL